MPAREITCTVLEKIWVTDTVVHIRFQPTRKFSFEPGQFLSVVFPSDEKRPPRRAYSFCLSLEASKKGGYELLIKVQPDGLGSRHMARLEKGDTFKAFAPYGDFLYRPPADGRQVVFICTGTGIAPFRSMILSKYYQEHAPEKALMLYGARTEDEALFQDLFQAHGVEVVNAISKPAAGWNGFKGRVTDYLRSLPTDWAWHSSDYYICGNGDMIAEVKRILLDGHGVSPKHVHQEAYFTVHVPVEQGAEQVTPPPLDVAKRRKAA